MADKVAMKFGKRVFKKKMAERQKSDRKANPYKGHDHYHYIFIDERGRNRGEKRKDHYYYTQILHLTPEEAKVAMSVNNRAKGLDGIKIGPWRLGWSTVIGLVPVGGDAVDGLLAMTVVWKAEKVPGGMDNATRGKMGFNVAMDVAIGVTPGLGDIADGFWQGNTRNAKLFEKFLIERLENKKKMEMAEQQGRATSRTRAHTDRYLDSEPASRSRQHVQTYGYYEPELPSQRRDRVQVNGYHDSEATPDLPPRGIDERHGGVHERLGRKAESPARTAPAIKSGGSWFSGRRSRKGDSAGQAVNKTRGREMTQVEDLAPARPPRPDTTRQQNAGHF
ncbi:hypothetical protein P7C71_g4576, partial [Lecanoromycetidae sp. Uapishka_2]